MVAGLALVPLMGGLTGLIPLCSLIGFGFGFGFSLTQTPIDRIINCPRRGLCGAVRSVAHLLANDLFLGRLDQYRAGFNVASRTVAVIGAAALAAVQRLWPAVYPNESYS